MPDTPSIQPFEGSSVCLFCGSTEAVDVRYLDAARAFGRETARRGWRLVYGGGGVGLMGAAARTAHAEGGRVLGIMPGFLRSRERLFDEVETVVVGSMHERKTLMYDQSDAFVVAPGGIGTLEEAIEVLSWKRLDLHRKPVVFLNIDGFWDDLVRTFEHSVQTGMTPASFQAHWSVADDAASAMDLLAAADDEQR